MVSQWSPNWSPGGLLAAVCLRSAVGRSGLPVGSQWSPSGLPSLVRLPYPMAHRGLLVVFNRSLLAAPPLVSQLLCASPPWLAGLRAASQWSPSGLPVVPQWSRNGLCVVSQLLFAYGPVESFQLLLKMRVPADEQELMVRWS